MAVKQNQNQEPKVVKGSSVTSGMMRSRMILRVSLVSEDVKRPVSLGDVFRIAGLNYGSEGRYTVVQGNYIPSKVSKGSSEARKFPAEYWGQMRLVITGATTMAADGSVAIIWAFITDDANKIAHRTPLESAKIEDLSLLKAGIRVQLIYNFDLQCGEVMLLALSDEKGERVMLTRSRLFSEWSITSIPEIPELQWFDPVAYRFVPQSYWDEEQSEVTTKKALPDAAEVMGEAAGKVEEVTGEVISEGEKAAEAAVVIESSTEPGANTSAEPLAESGTESVVEGSDKPGVKTETTEDQAAVEQDQPATVANGSGQAPTQEQISRILAMSQASDKDLSPEDRAAVSELLKGMSPERLGQ